MNRCLIVCLFLFGQSVKAQTGYVEKSGGTKALIKFNGAPPKEGTTVTLGGSSSSNSGSSSGLRKRVHNIYYSSDIGLSNSTENGTAYQTYENRYLGVNSLLNVTLAYTYNLGKFEFGGLLSNIQYATVTSNSSTATTKLELGGIAQYNIFPNEPGVDLVPYARFQFTIPSLTLGSIKISGNLLEFSGGVLWYPFGQIFAFDAGLAYTKASFSQTVGSTSTTSNVTSIAAQGGWRLSF